ncbi:MAG TPA: TonB-dependent siderophore receptor [Rhodocyclaceae bacterium]|jgi:catecholate siderophore receptor
MAYIKCRKHPARLTTALKPAAALTVLAMAAPYALAEDAQLPEVSVSSSAYKVDNAASTKYTAPLVDTPKTVTVITEEVLKETNASSLKEALRTTPGITFGMGEGGSPEGDNPIIRGFNAQASTFIDGLRDPSSQSRNMFAVEQIDVTKGADSAFSGGGAVGGSINLTTKNAKLGNFSEASFGVGTDSYLRGTVDLNRQLNDNSAIRLNLLKEKGDVPGRDSVDYDHLGANVSAAFGLGTATRVTTGLYHYETDDMPDYGIPYNNPVAKYNTIAAGAGGSTTTTPPTVAPTLNATASANGDGSPLSVNRNNFYGLTGRDFRKTNVDSGTLKIEHDLNDKWVFRNATRYTKSLNDYVASNPGDSNASIVTGTTLPRSAKSRHSVTEAWVNDTQLSGEFLTGAVKHNVTLGVELTRTATDSRGYTVTGTSNASITNPNPNDPWTGTVTRATSGAKTTTNTSGMYAFDTLTLTPQWLLNLGLRYDTFRTAGDNYTTNGAAATADLVSNSSFTSYQTGLVFKPMENGSVYLNYATAANPSGATMSDGSDNLATTNKDLEPEKVKNIELGTKWNLLNNKLTLTGAIFNLTKTNAKVNLDANTVSTVGEQKTKGIELGFAGSLTDKWQVFGGYTYMDSILSKTGPSYWSYNSTSAVWTYNANADALGKQFPNTPKHSFSLWSSYKVQPGLTLGGGAYYVSKVYGNTLNTKWVPDYWRFDAMANYEVSKQLSLRLNIQNLFDKTYYDRAYTTHMVSVAPARQVTLTANYKF